MHSIAGWWDGIELWVAALPFLPQFAVVLIGMVPISFVLAYLLDRGLQTALRMLGRDRQAVPEPGAAPQENRPKPDSAEEEPPGHEFIGPAPVVSNTSDFANVPRPSARPRQKETV